MKAQVDEAAGETVKKTVKKGKKGGKKKKTLKVDAGCEILMKDKDGNVIKFESEDDQEME